MKDSGDGNGELTEMSGNWCSDIKTNKFGGIRLSLINYY